MPRVQAAHGARVGHGTARRRAPGATGRRTALRRRKFRTGMITNQPDDGSTETVAIRQPTADCRLQTAFHSEWAASRRHTLFHRWTYYVPYVMALICTLCQVPIIAFLSFWFMELLLTKQYVHSLISVPHNLTWFELRRFFNVITPSHRGWSKIYIDLFVANIYLLILS